MNKAERYIKRCKDSGYTKASIVNEIFDKKFRKATFMPPEYSKALDKYFPYKEAQHGKD